LISLAGPAAERRLRGRHNWKSASSDIHQTLGLLKYLSDSDPEMFAYANLVQVRAKGMIETSWKEVQAVANALLERKRLTGKEVAGIMSVASNPGLRRP
jgi:hypothetical protein